MSDSPHPPQLSSVVAMRPRTQSCPLPNLSHPSSCAGSSAPDSCDNFAPLGLRDRCPHLWPSPPLHSPHPIPSIGGSHALPLLPKRGVCSTGGTATGANRDRERPKSFASGFVSCRPPSTGITRQLPPQNSQAAPTPLPSTYFRREPTRGAAGGGQGPTASPRASGHTEPSAPSSRGTPRAPCPSHLGLCCSVSGPARRGRTVPGERRDKGGPPRTLPGPCGPFTSVFGCRTQNI